MTNLNHSTHRWASPSKAVNVLLHRFWFDTSLLHALLEQGCDVHALTPGENLFSAKEEIIRIRDFLRFPVRLDYYRTNARLLTSFSGSGMV